MPLYTHDCDRCEYLGVVLDDRDHPRDAYVCTQGSFRSRTWVARRSDEGSDYSSGASRRGVLARVMMLDPIGQQWLLLDEQSHNLREHASYLRTTWRSLRDQRGDRATMDMLSDAAARLDDEIERIERERDALTCVSV